MQAQRAGDANTDMSSTVKASADATAFGPSPQAGDATTLEGMAAPHTLSLRCAHSPTPVLCVFV